MGRQKKNADQLRQLLEKKSSNLFDRYKSLWEYAENNYLKYMNIENFTDHGVGHVQKVEENIFNLLTREARNKLSSFDLFCLLAACCLHDIGMIDKKKPKESYYKVRRDHHARTKELLKKEYSKFGLNQQEGKIIGEICYGHGVSDIEGELGMFDDWSIEPYGDINVMFLVALLRIGDLTDLSFRRAPELVVELKKINGESLPHWSLHEKIANIKFDHKNSAITIIAYVDDEFELTKLYRLRKWVDHELSNVREFFIKNGISLDTVYLHTNLHKKKVLSKENPFIKLASFDWAKHAAFFGRNKEINDIMERVLTKDLLVLVGESGVGKTSLLNAGLKQHLIENGDYVFESRISDNFKENLYKTMKAQFSGFRPKNIFDLLKKASTDGFNLILIIDQFEEIFTLHDYIRVRDEILVFFREILNGEEVALKIVLSIREDFLAELWEISEIVPQLYNRENTYRLKKLNRVNAEQIITNTINHINYSIEDDLVQQLLDDFTEEAETIYPPYIQIVCHEIFKRHKESYKESEKTPLNISIYERLGGAKEIISGYFEEILDEFSFDERVVINEILAPMVTYFHTKQRISYEEILEINNNRIDIAKTFDKLIERRIIKKIESEKNEYELIHDFLAKKILENKPAAGVSSKIKKAIEIIESNYDKPITLQEVAGQLGFSREHLSRRFKAETNINFIDYTNDIRIKKAKKIIDKDPKIKINEVYKNVGFTNAQHFSKTFKKIVGRAPKEYKESIQESNSI